MTENYVQLPTDGSGKRLHTRPFIELAYDGGTIAFSVGDIVVGALSGTTATVVAVSGTTTSGTLTLLPSSRSSVTFTDNENLEVSGMPYAVANGIGTPIHNQAMSIVSPDSPTNVLKIDPDGAAYIRHTDGAQLIDASGRSQISKLTAIGVYDFEYSSDDWIITTSSVGAGSVTYSHDDRSLLLSVPAASGAIARVVSRKYHKAHAYSGIEGYGTFVTNNVGIAGNVRRAGMFDAENGVFYTITGTLSGLVVRSSASGATIDTFISSSAFNGSSPSNGALDVTTVNKYYMDFNSSGRARFGIFDPDGSRRVLHTIKSLNSDSQLFLGTINLPIRVEVENLEATAGTSEVRFFGATVTTQAELSDDHLVNYQSHANNDAFITVTGSDNHIMTVRPTALYNGYVNRTALLLDDVSFGVDAAIAPILRFNVLRNASLTTASWTPLGGKSASEFTAVTGSYVLGSGELVHSEFFSATSRFDIEHVASYLNEFVCNDWDGTQNSSYTYTVDVLSGSNVGIMASVGIREVQ